MTWAALFERTADCPVTVAEVREQLARHRGEGEAENTPDEPEDGR